MSPSRLIIWRPFKPIFFKFCRPRTGLASLFGGQAQSADNFQRNSFVHGNLIAPYFRLFQWRLRASYKLAPPSAARLARRLVRHYGQRRFAKLNEQSRLCYCEVKKVSLFYSCDRNDWQQADTLSYVVPPLGGRHVQRRTKCSASTKWRPYGNSGQEKCTQYMLYSPYGHENYSPDTIAKPNRSQSSIPWLPRCAHVWAHSSLALDFGWKDKICMLIPETQPFDQDFGYAKKLCSLHGYVAANVSMVCVCVWVGVCVHGEGCCRPFGMHYITVTSNRCIIQQDILLSATKITNNKNKKHIFVVFRRHNRDVHLLQKKKSFETIGV
jgi:hypothetical protein